MLLTPAVDQQQGQEPTLSPVCPGKDSVDLRIENPYSIGIQFRLGYRCLEALEMNIDYTRNSIEVFLTSESCSTGSCRVLRPGSDIFLPHRRGMRLLIVEEEVGNFKTCNLGPVDHCKGTHGPFYGHSQEMFH